MSADLASVVVRSLSFVGLFQAVGAAFFLALFGEWAPHSDSAIRRLGIGAALAGAALLACHQCLEAARMSDDFSGLFDARMEGLAWRGRGGTATMLQILGVAVVAVGLSRKGKAGLTSACIGGCVAACAAVLTGHTSIHAQRLLLGFLLSVHLLVVAFWFGALVPLVVCTRREPRPAAVAVLNGFSMIAAPLVPCIAIAGLAMALILMPERAAWSTPYGGLVLAKIAAFGVLMVLAAWNRWRGVPAMSVGVSQDAVISLRRAIGIEYALIVGVLTTTAVMTAFFSP